MKFILLLVVILSYFSYSNAVIVKVVAQRDDLMKNALANQCGMSRSNTWGQFEKTCGALELNKKNFYAAMDAVKTNNAHVIVVQEHSSNASPNGKLQMWPKIHFPIKKPDGKFKYPPVDRKAIEKKWRGLSNHDFIMFVWGCSGDRRGGDPMKLKRTKIRLGVREVKKNNGGYVSIRSDFGKDILAPQFEDMIHIHDDILHINKKNQFFTATLKEATTYYALRDMWLKDENKKELFPGGFVMVHNIPGSLTYPSLASVAKNLIKDMKSAKSVTEVHKHLKDLVTANKKETYGSNYFVATITHQLQRSFDIIRFCRSGLIRRARSTIAFDTNVIVQCIGGEQNDTYMKYMDCCCSEIAKTSNEKISKSRYERSKRRAEQRTRSQSQPTTSSNSNTNRF